MNQFLSTFNRHIFNLSGHSQNKSSSHGFKVEQAQVQPNEHAQRGAIDESTQSPEHPKVIKITLFLGK